MSHRVTLAWVGGEHVFALPIGRLRAIQDRTDAGPEELLRRLSAGIWRVDDLVEILRQGLIGGGLDEAEAGKLVLGLVDLHGWVGLRETAYRVLGAALIGPKKDPVGEPKGVPTPPDSGASPASTASAP